MTVLLSRRIVLSIHDEQFAEHGGPIGVRDEGLLERAPARPLNRAGCGDKFPVSDHDAVIATPAIANGKMSDDDVTTWVRNNTRPPGA
jgi:prophage maintenance system killer protein